MGKVVFISDHEIEGVKWRIGVMDARVVMAMPLVAEKALKRVSERLMRRLGVRFEHRPSAVGDMTASYIGGFLRGERRELDFDVLLSGSEFQMRVWDELRRIGRGERVTYGELALRCGCPGAVRAVAGACGANAVLLAVPCHRVVAANDPGGFSAGQALKAKLLAMEGSGIE